MSGAPLREGVIGEVMGRAPGVTEVREGLGTAGAPAILAVARGETLPGYAGKVCPNTEVQVRTVTLMWEILLYYKLYVIVNLHSFTLALYQKSCARIDGFDAIISNLC